MTEPLIVCENLVKIYSISNEGGVSVEVQALQGLDITVNDGEMLGVVGASGSGKSTLLNVLGCGLLVLVMGSSGWRQGSLGSLLLPAPGEQARRHAR